MRPGRRTLRGSSIAAAALIAAIPETTSAQSASLPPLAVSQPNVKVEAGGGAADGDGMGGGAASLAIPLTQLYGLQADAGYYRAAGDDVYGGALHAFFRDPNTRLIGVTALSARIGDATLFRTGIESEFYLDRVTIAPSAGFQRFLDKDSAYGSLRVTYYPTDRLSLGVSTAGYSGAFGVGASGEYQLDGSNASLFVDAGGSDPGGGYVFAGVRFWFGGDNGGLIARDRRSDPPNLTAFWNTPAGNALLAQAADSRIPVFIPPEPPCCGCFVSGAEVLMADGSVKRIEDIMLGEEVMGADGVSNPVAALQRPDAASHVLMSINRGPFIVNTRHAIATREGWKAGYAKAANNESYAFPLAQLAVGDEIRTRDGYEAVKSIDMKSSGAPIDLYNLIAAGDNTFHVRAGDGFILVHG